jgi:cbb3-type cytochrome oxidase maturation protein
MNIIFVLIPLSIVILIAAIWAFFWAIKSGQYDDMDSPAWRVVFDDDRQPPAVDSRPDRTDNDSPDAQ